jgi:hypothetical protein
MTMSMQSMALTDEEKHDMVMPIAMAERPEYPYSLRLSLCDSEIEKLGIDPEEATVGGMVHIEALARITSVSCDDREGGKTYRLELQIEDMGVIGGSEPSAESRPKRARLYD